MDKNSRPFLDILVLKSSEANITFDVFYKKTSTHRYLNFSSCHKSHVKRNLPCNLARRLVTIVSDPDQLEFRLSELRQFLLKCNYPKKLINNCFKRAKTQGPRFNYQKSIIPLVVTYNPRHPIDFNLIKGLMENFESKHLQEVFKPFKMIKSSRQNPNLKRLLTRADFNSSQNNVSGITHCNNERCDICPGNLFKPSSGELLFSITQTFSCKSGSVIYFLTCTVCKDSYVGETGNLRKRMNNHKSHTRYPNTADCLSDPHFHKYLMKKYGSLKEPLFFCQPFYNVNAEQKEYIMNVIFVNCLNQY